MFVGGQGSKMFGNIVFRQEGPFCQVEVLFVLDDRDVSWVMKFLSFRIQRAGGVFTDFQLIETSTCLYSGIHARLFAYLKTC